MFEHEGRVDHEVIFINLNRVATFLVVVQDTDQELEGILHLSLDEVYVQTLADAAVGVYVPLSFDGGERFFQVLVFFDDVQFLKGVGGNIPKPHGLAVSNVDV